MESADCKNLYNIFIFPPRLLVISEGYDGHHKLIVNVNISTGERGIRADKLNLSLVSIFITASSLTMWEQELLPIKCLQLLFRSISSNSRRQQHYNSLLSCVRQHQLSIDLLITSKAEGTLEYHHS